MTNFLKIIDLQRFAEDGETQPNDASQDTSKQKEDKKADSTEPFKTFATEKDFQSALDSYFDKKSSKWLENQKAKWEADQQAKKDYSKMSDDEKHEYDLKQAEKKLAEREHELIVRENRADVTSRLADDGLPTTLVDAFKLEDTDSIDKQYDNIKKVFSNAVDAQVQRKLAKSTGIPAGGGSSKHESRGAALAKEANQLRAKPKKSLWS